MNYNKTYILEEDEEEEVNPPLQITVCLSMQLLNKLLYNQQNIDDLTIWDVKQGM